MAGGYHSNFKNTVISSELKRSIEPSATGVSERNQNRGKSLKETRSIEPTNRSVSGESFARSNEKPASKKKYKDDSEAINVSTNVINWRGMKQDSTSDSNKSPSVFEDISVGQHLEQL